MLRVYAHTLTQHIPPVMKDAYIIHHYILQLKAFLLQSTKDPNVQYMCMTWTSRGSLTTEVLNQYQYRTPL